MGIDMFVSKEHLRLVGDGGGYSTVTTKCSIDVGISTAPRRVFQEVSYPSVGGFTFHDIIYLYGHFEPFSRIAPDVPVRASSAC